MLVDAARVDGDVAVTDLGLTRGEREAPRVEWADDRVEPDDAVGERAAPVGALGLGRSDATSAQAEDGDVLPGHPEGAALAHRNLIDRAQPMFDDALRDAHEATPIGAANWFAVAGLAASVCQGST